MNAIEMKEYNGGTVGVVVGGILGSVVVISVVAALTVGLQMAFSGKRRN
jgi:hypothetical protein